jgi:hypothetical protein
MKRTLLTLIAAAGLAAGGCSSGGPNDPVSAGQATGADTQVRAPDIHHDFNPPNPVGEYGSTDPVGGGGGIHVFDPTTGPVTAARFHGCTKITYAALGSILNTRGAKLTGATDALGIYKTGASSLAIANYSGRAPEALLASTSALAKQFDIFVAAAPEVVANAATSTGCAGVTIADASGKFTKDGLTCLLGTLATDDHVTVANQAVSDAVAGGATQAQGVQLAIAALLEAAHTCE